MKKQIIAHGGGGFASRNKSTAVEKYMLTQTGKTNPKICFLPQASKEEPLYIAKFFETFCQLGAQPSWISLFGRVEQGWQEKILNADIVYVGGGNTKSMIALWQAWGIDTLLKQAYEKGIVLAGVSAGAICWFEYGITDSIWPLGNVKALGLLTGTMCPHFDSEHERQDVFQSLVDNNTVPSGIALEDNVAAHFIDGRLHHIIASENEKKAFLIKQHTKEIITTTIFL